MIENMRIKTVIQPLYKYDTEKEEDVEIGHRILTVVWADKFSTFAVAPNGEIGIVDEVHLICLDSKAQEKEFITVSIDDVKIGRYENTEFRRGRSSLRGKRRTDRSIGSPGDR